MCFYHDDEWRAEVVEKDDLVSDGAAKCDECRRVLPAGEAYTHTYMQRYEECHDCDAGYCSCGDDECCQCSSPNYGEEFDHDCCALCEKVLEAIRLVEVANGCTGTETRPACGELRQAVRDDEGGAYAARALEMHPDIGPHLALLKE